jgi:DNA-binding PadR family transcriptional regulator
MPLKPLVFETLLELAAGERHGWALVRDLESRTGSAILPGNFYRTLRGMVADGLIEEIDAPASRSKLTRALPETGLNADRRRYLRLTTHGRDVARAEARRLDSLVAESRARRLLSDRKRP